MTILLHFFKFVCSRNFTNTLVLILLSRSSAVKAQAVKFFLAETNSTITVSFLPDKQSSKEFRTIIIQSSAGTMRFIAHDPIIRIPATRKERNQDFIWNANVPGLKIDPSRFFLVGQYADSKPHTLLFFLSTPYASDASPLLIIGFSSLGKPFKVFEKEYELKSFEPGDNGALMIGSESVSQAECVADNSLAASSATYDPYSIFVIHPDSKPVYLLEASRDYNLKHYVWAGPHASERFTVIRNLPGYPKIFVVPGPQADKLITKVKCTP